MMWVRLKWDVYDRLEGHVMHSRKDDASGTSTQLSTPVLMHIKNTTLLPGKRDTVSVHSECSTNAC